MEADASRHNRIAGDETIDWSDPNRDSRPAREYLAALDPDCQVPKSLSPTDPSAAWTIKANRKVQFGYGLNYLIDNARRSFPSSSAAPLDRRRPPRTALS